MAMSVMIENAVYAGFKVTKASADGKKGSKVIHQLLADDKVIKLSADAGTSEVAKLPTGTVVNASIDGVTYLKQEFSDIFMSGATVSVHKVK